jgi:hypothetical protein
MRHTDSKRTWLQENRMMAMEALKGEGGAFARHPEERRCLINRWRAFAINDELVQRRPHRPVQIVYTVEVVGGAVVVAAVYVRAHRY